MKKRLITGGCGFIGSNFVRHMIATYPDDYMVNLDLLTYAGKPENLDGIDTTNYSFIKGNICDQRLVDELFRVHDFDEVINFAAESHVDNSIQGPRVFIETNVTGTMNLLDCALRAWQKRGETYKTAKRFVQISTDEVYGSLGEEGSFTESSPLDPSSPYSASKASADLLARAYYVTYGMPVLITRCTNNYGPYQDTEKLIPLMITNALRDIPLPVYGDGCNVRDWIHVMDHCRGIERVLQKGRVGEVYNIGGGNEWKNIDVVTLLLAHLGKPKSLIQFVTDRLGHDRRYALDGTKVRDELGWEPEVYFKNGLADTVEWFVKQYSGT